MQGLNQLGASPYALGPPALSRHHMGRRCQYIHVGARSLRVYLFLADKVRRTVLSSALHAAGPLPEGS